MTTAEIVMERALALAGAGVEDEGAVQEVLSSAGGNRVAVIIARRHLMEESEDQGGAGQAVEILDEVLRRLPAE
jgi:hypothetical protein